MSAIYIFFATTEQFLQLRTQEGFWKLVQPKADREKIWSTSIGKHFITFITAVSCHYAPFIVPFFTILSFLTFINSSFGLLLQNLTYLELIILFAAFTGLHPFGLHPANNASSFWNFIRRYLVSKGNQKDFCHGWSREFLPPLLVESTWSKLDNCTSLVNHFPLSKNDWRTPSPLEQQQCWND